MYISSLKVASSPLTVPSPFARPAAMSFTALCITLHSFVQIESDSKSTFWATTETLYIHSRQPMFCHGIAGVPKVSVRGVPNRADTLQILCMCNMCRTRRIIQAGCCVTRLLWRLGKYCCRISAFRFGCPSIEGLPQPASFLQLSCSKHQGNGECDGCAYACWWSGTGRRNSLTHSAASPVVLPPGDMRSMESATNTSN